MRPIDTIREQLDSDFIKNRNVSLCKIIDEKSIKSIAGVGLCAIVTPLCYANEYVNEEHQDVDSFGFKEQFPVVIVNRTGRWFESNISQKYYAMLINPFHDRKGLSPALLVPKSAIDDIEVINMIGDINNPAINSDGENLQCMSRYFMMED